MLELSAAGRAGTPDEVGNVGPDGALITGSDFLMDGVVTADGSRKILALEQKTLENQDDGFSQNVTVAMV